MRAHVCNWYHIFKQQSSYFDSMKCFWVWSRLQAMSASSFTLWWPLQRRGQQSLTGKSWNNMGFIHLSAFLPPIMQFVLTCHLLAFAKFVTNIRTMSLITFVTEKQWWSHCYWPGRRVPTWILKCIVLMYRIPGDTLGPVALSPLRSWRMRQITRGHRKLRWLAGWMTEKPKWRQIFGIGHG